MDERGRVGEKAVIVSGGCGMGKLQNMLRTWARLYTQVIDEGAVQAEWDA